MKKVSLYWHTLRHLKAVQFYSRVWLNLYRPKVDLSPEPSPRTSQAQWAKCCRRPKLMHGSTEFCFLNQTVNLKNASDWNSTKHAKLWLYNLHYFDDLNADGAETRKAWHEELIHLWITSNPPAYGNGWEPYPLSLRIVNWIKWALAGNELQSEMLQSLAVQIRYLRKSLEWHLLGNHLFANAKALIFAGLYFQGSEADAWLDKGLSILKRELPEQILPDGGHFELSPMYHSIILEDMLDLLNISNQYPDRLSSNITLDWRNISKAMLNWLRVMCHPDGQISFFNDATLGIAAEPRNIFAYAERLGIECPSSPREGVTHLKDSGYIRVQNSSLVALLDVAKVGPDYIPGHAHADTLSFELSISGQRIIVNSGISVYGDGAERLNQRSTTTHSTVEINGKNSSEVWGGFRVARRAHPFDLNIEERSDEILICCSHDGYQRLKGHVTHKREWRFREKSVEIVDEITGHYEIALAHFYLHPDIKSAGSTHKGELNAPGLQAVAWSVSGAECDCIDATYHPEFGASISNLALRNKFLEPHSNMTLSW